MQSVLRSVWLASPLVTPHDLENPCIVKNEDMDWHKHHEKFLCSPKVWTEEHYQTPNIRCLLLALSIKFILFTSLTQRNFLLQQALDTEYCQQRQYKELERQVIYSKAKSWSLYQNVFTKVHIMFVLFFCLLCSIPLKRKYSYYSNIFWGKWQEENFTWMKSQSGDVYVLSRGCELAKGTSIHQLSAAPRGCRPGHDTPTAQPVT